MPAHDSKMPEQRFVVSRILEKLLPKIATRTDAALASDLERQVDRLQTLNQVSRELSATLDDKAIFGAVTQAVVRTLDCTHCTVFGLEEGILVPRAAHGKDQDVRISRRLALGEGLAGWAAQQGQSILAPDARKDDRFVKGKTRPDVERSMIVVPLKVDRQVVGVISADQDRIGAFDERDLQMVETLALQTGIALQNAGLLMQERQRANVMDLLRTISTTISTPLDIKKALDLTIQGALKLTGADAGVIHLIDQAGQAISHSHQFPAGSSHLASRFADKTGLTWEAFQTGEIVEVLDVSHSRRVSSTLAQSDVKSLIGVPLKQANRVIGVLFLNSFTQRSLAADEREILTTLAEQAALAIGQARQRVQDISVLQEINEAILHRGLDDVTQLIAEKATTLTRANYATLRLVDESGQYLRAKAVKGRETRQEYLPIDEHSFTGWVAMKGQAALCPDVKADPHYVAWYPDIKSCMAVPLKRNGQVIGTLYVESTQPAAFSERYQLDLLQSLANQAAIAIENAGLVQELDERAERLVRLQQVTATISAEPSDLTKVLYLITDSLDKIFKGVSCAIRLYDSLKDEFGPRVAVGIIQVLVDHPPRPEGTSRHIIQTKAPLYVEDASVIPLNGMPSLRQEVMAVGIKAAAYLPLLLEGETIGILYVDLTEPRRFSQYDKQILELFAYQAAIAIENARKYDELRRTKGLVGSRTALAWMGMVSNTWRHAIEGHAVNILDSLHLLRRNLSAGADDETVEKRLCTIERLARKIQEKPITPPISSEEGVDSVCVNTLIRERVQQLWQYSPHNAVACQWNLAQDEEVTVRASSEWLRRALDIVLDNAVEAMEGSQVKELTVLTQRAEGRVQVTVTDTGAGIPPEVEGQLFDRPVKKLEGGKGLGMGLLMAQMIVQTYGGDIYVGCTGPGGTAMVLELAIEN